MLFCMTYLPVSQAHFCFGFYRAKWMHQLFAAYLCRSADYWKFDLKMSVFHIYFTINRTNYTVIKSKVVGVPTITDFVIICI